PAKGTPQGALFTNLGGPGAATVESVTNVVPGIGMTYQVLFSNDLLTAYDLILWDPRGTGTTIPVTCFEDDAARDEHFFGDPTVNEPGAAAYVQELRDYYTAYGQECLRLSGPELEFIDSISTAT